MKAQVARTRKPPDLVVMAMLLVVAVPLAARNSARVESPLALASSDGQLVEAFTWASRQASAYAFEGDAVGAWFEAALPGREAFCMRDVAHQAMGGHALGLQAHLRNMMGRFAGNVSDARDWCSLWEIDRHNRPAHADYRNDLDFWYNLPANFDVLDACYRMFLWSGDPAYVTDPVLLHFYDRTVTDYVARWKLGVDDVMTRPRLMNQAPPADPDAKFTQARGIPGYNEGADDFVAGLDLLAAEYAAFHAYARIQEARGNVAAARTWLAKAADVKALVNTRWWDEKAGRFFDHLTTTYVLAHRSDSGWNSAELRHLPVRANDLTIRHDGVTATVFTNNRGPAVVWRAAFPGRLDALVVNGVRVKATRLVLPPGREVSVARVVVAPGVSARVEVPRQ